MPRPRNGPEPLYRRDPLWLDFDRRSDGSLRSSNLYVWWHDDKGRVRSSSTGTRELEAGRLALDRIHDERHGRTCAFCQTCGQPIAKANLHLLADAIDDYWCQIGVKKESNTAIKARINHLLDFLEEQDREDTLCSQVTDGFAADFRQWSQDQPVIVPTKKGAPPKYRQRSPATTEESLNTLKAALNYAVKIKKIESAPVFKTLQRKDVTTSSLVRLPIETLAKMLAYAATPKKKRSALHSFLVGSICTLARPDAVVDISVDRKRRQWIPESGILNLNPAGRIQTKKVRPCVGVPRQLKSWLEQTLGDPRSGGWLVSYAGEPIHDVDSAWNTMLAELGLPDDPEHKSYVIRRSMATILRNLHRNGGPMVDYQELREQMGHARQNTTDIYALVIPEPTSTVQVGIQWVLDRIEELEPNAFKRINRDTKEETVPDGSQPIGVIDAPVNDNASSVAASNSTTAPL